MQTPSIMKLLENICWSYGIWSGKQRIWEAEGWVSRELMPVRSGVSVLPLVPENLLEESLVTTRMGWVRAGPGVRGKAAFTHTSGNGRRSTALLLFGRQFRTPDRRKRNSAARGPTSLRPGPAGRQEPSVPWPCPFSSLRLLPAFFQIHWGGDRRLGGCCLAGRWPLGGPDVRGRLGGAFRGPGQALSPQDPMPLGPD